MRYVLEDLLRVRQFREDAAANAVVQQRGRVTYAEQELAGRRRELTEFAAWRARQEESLYQQVMHKQILRKDLDDLKAALQELQLQELARQQKIMDAERALDEARKALQAAQQAHTAAVKAREKLNEHKAIWLQDALKEAEDLQEKEVEDFRVKDPEKEDEDSERDADSEAEDEDEPTLAAPARKRVSPRPATHLGGSLGDPYRT